MDIDRKEERINNDLPHDRNKLNLEIKNVLIQSFAIDMIFYM